MSEQVKVSGVYYSSTGTVYELAKSITEGAEKAGAEVRLRKVHELAPDEAIAANAGQYRARWPGVDHPCPLKHRASLRWHRRRARLRRPDHVR
jgi:multimeric flavodoxin WrbA